MSFQKQKVSKGMGKIWLLLKKLGEFGLNGNVEVLRAGRPEISAKKILFEERTIAKDLLCNNSRRNCP